MAFKSRYFSEAHVSEVIERVIRDQYDELDDAGKARAREELLVVVPVILDTHEDVIA